MKTQIDNAKAEPKSIHDKQRTCGKEEIVSNRELAAIPQRSVQKQHERSKKEGNGKHQQHTNSFRNKTQSSKEKKTTPVINEKK